LFTLTAPFVIYSTPGLPGQILKTGGHLSETVALAGTFNRTFGKINRFSAPCAGVRLVKLIGENFNFGIALRTFAGKNT
jgi:hypothetical protein